MKVPGCRHLVLAYAVGILLLVSVLAPLVTADLAVGTITHVYFTKDGLPYNGSVRYTVTCYGYASGYTYQDAPDPSLPNDTPSEVYRYSATCGNFGCAVYEPYYRINSGGMSWLSLSRCDVTGEAGGRPFTISNFSDRPYTKCTGLPEPYRVPGDYPAPDSSYYMTEEYYACDSRHRNISVNVTHRIFSSCNLSTDAGCFAELLPSGIPLRQESLYLTTKNGTEMGLDQYMQFLETCNPATDPDCGGIVVNGKPLKTMHEFRPFYNRSYTSTEYPCITFLVLANRSLVLPREIEDSSPRPLIDNKVRDICEARWAIPPENATGSVFVPPDQVGHITMKNGLEIFWCTLRQFLGGRCG